MSNIIIITKLRPKCSLFDMQVVYDVSDNGGRLILLKLALFQFSLTTNLFHASEDHSRVTGQRRTEICGCPEAIPPVGGS